MNESPYQLAASVRHLTDAIPRDISPARLPIGKKITEDELLSALRNGTDPEISIHGLLARVKLLESQVARLVKLTSMKRAQK